MINDNDYTAKPTAIHILRQQLESNRAHSQEEKAILKAGFVSPFWKICLKDLTRALDTCRNELETCKDHFRLLQLQGEIAALRVLLNTHNVLLMDIKKPGPPIASS